MLRKAELKIHLSYPFWVIMANNCFFNQQTHSIYHLLGYQSNIYSPLALCLPNHAKQCRKSLFSCFTSLWPAVCLSFGAKQVRHSRFFTLFLTFSLKTLFLLRLKTARVMKEVELRLEQLSKNETCTLEHCTLCRNVGHKIGP